MPTVALNLGTLDEHSRANIQTTQHTNTHIPAHCQSDEVADAKTDVIMKSSRARDYPTSGAGRTLDELGAVRAHGIGSDTAGGALRDRVDALAVHWKIIRI